MRKLILLVVILSLFAVESQAAQITIMPLGASITMGYGSSEENGYRRELRDLLVSHGYDVDFVGSLENGTFEDRQHEGHGGFKIGQIADNVYDKDGWLNSNPAQIILLHVGTNNITNTNAYTTPDEIETLLEEIELWEQNNTPVFVVLPRLINRICANDDPPCPASGYTTDFNDNVMAMAQARIDDLGDRLVLVDMENGAGLDYHLYPDGDMSDDIHPYDNGYAKMAATWFFDGLLKILPWADAGADQSVDEKILVTLDGSGSNDPDGTGLTYMWEQIPPGTTVTLAHPTSEKPTFTAPAVGSSGERLTFELTVTDADLFEHSDTVYVDINNVLIPPVADAGPDKSVMEGRTVVLSGSGSNDPDGTITSFQWEQVSGKNQVDLKPPDDEETTFTAPAVDAEGDVLTFKLTVKDNDDLITSGTVAITVYKPEAPIANAGMDQKVGEGRTVTLNGSNSDDPDGTITSFQWEQVSGKNQVDLKPPDGEETTFTAPAVDAEGDVMTFRLTVKDNDGLVNSDTVSVTVYLPEAPVADAGPDQSVTEGRAVTLDGSNSYDPNGTNIAAQWEQLTGSTQVDLNTSTDLETTFTAPAVDANGDELTFKLTINDGDGLTSEDEVKVTITPDLVSATSSNGGSSGGGGCFIQAVLE